MGRTRPLSHTLGGAREAVRRVNCTSRQLRVASMQTHHVALSTYRSENSGKHGTETLPSRTMSFERHNHKLDWSVT